MYSFYEVENEIEVFERCFHVKLPLLLKGPTGCGKSHLVEFMAHRLDRPLVKVVCNEDTNAADLLGRFVIKGGDTLWIDGPITRALRENAILYIDEVAEAREDVMVALHPLTDFRRQVYLDKINETINAQSQFMVVASFNPGYQSSLREMKPSTRQRFVTLSMNYLPLEKEAHLLVEQTGVDKASALNLAKLAKSIRNSEQFLLKETVSTRLVVNAALLIKSGMDTRSSCHVAIAEVLTDDRQSVDALKDFINLSV